MEGNWVVKRAAGSTPAILGTKLKQHHFRGDNYLETDLEIGACDRARATTDRFLERPALVPIWLFDALHSISLPPLHLIAVVQSDGETLCRKAIATLVEALPWFFVQFCHQDFLSW